MVECERGEGWKNDEYLNVANRVFGHLAIAGEGGAGKKPAGVGGGGNESPENDRTNEEGDHENCDNSNEEGDQENCDYFFSKSEDRQRKTSPAPAPVARPGDLVLFLLGMLMFTCRDYFLS